MYFSRVRLNILPEKPELFFRYFKKDNYSVHQLLWHLFPDDPDAKRDFLFRQERVKGWPVFYMVSFRQPLGQTDALRVETKVYQPRVREGERLAFSLRVNPVVTKKNGGTGKKSRHDVVMAAKKELKHGDFQMSELIYEEGLKWLTGRSNSLGFRAESVSVEGYSQHWLKKTGNNNIRFSTLDYRGLLTVTDQDRFSGALYDGIGRAKAFGCGLLMVQRVS